MLSCILALYFVVPAARPAAQAPSDPDTLYRQREDIASARRAADLWEARTEAGSDFESAWKLARACYWLGTRAPENDRRAALERGVKAGEMAARIAPDRPDGHFWLAANMGALAESFGVTQGLKYRGRIKASLERVLAIDAAWQQGSADRALGWWYHKVPGLFGGSEDRAEAHLRKALTFNPQSTATLYFLGEVLIERNRKADARAMLQRAIDAPLDPDWTPEDRDFQRQAAARLATIAR